MTVFCWFVDLKKTKRRFSSRSMANAVGFNSGGINGSRLLSYKKETRRRAARFLSSPCPRRSLRQGVRDLSPDVILQIARASAREKRSIV